MRQVLPIVFILAIAGCSTMVNRATQEITIETPGASGALCFLERPGYSSRVWAPKTVRLTKSKYDLSVRCIAPGNREKVEIVKPELPDSFFLNVANGLVPGALIDHETGAMFSLPEKVVVDFTTMQPKSMPPPDYQEVLDQNPDIAVMEEFRPGKSALQRDRNRPVSELQPRRSDGELYSNSGMESLRGQEAPETAAAPAAAPVSPPAGDEDK